MNSSKLPHTECPECQLLFIPTEHDDLIMKLVDENNQMRIGLLDIEQTPPAKERTPRQFRAIASNALRAASNRPSDLTLFFKNVWSKTCPEEYRKTVNEKQKHIEEVYGIGFEKKLNLPQTNDSLLEENTRLRNALERITRASTPAEEPVSRMIALSALGDK